MDVDIIEKAQVLSQESEMLNERAIFIDEQIQELAVFRKDLEILEDNTSGEMLANIGKGLYVSSKITGEEIFVNVGAGVLIKKSIPEAKKVIDEQILRLGDMRERINMRLVSLMSELNSIKLMLEKEKGI